jgi:methylenetetrahydrofolate reductase (NADPH)
MKTVELFDASRKVYSLEIFPPKREYPIETIFETLDGLHFLRPDFISVTFGAGGSSDGATTIQIATMIRDKYGIESVAHIPCINLTKDDVRAILEQLQRNGIENILALRGDRVEGREPCRDFAHASDLISFIHEEAPGAFDILGACYPETHPEAKSAEQDIAALKVKQDAGASHFISQLFFDNETFYDFVSRARAAGVSVPIEAGIMPVVNRRQIERMTTLCGASLPEKFLSMMRHFDGNKTAMRDAGIAYAVNQIVDLLAHDVDGIHLYTMNNPLIATRIDEATRSLFGV